MIDKFSNVNSKSFVDYYCNESLAKINIFFGMNGSGKSGLTKWIKSKNPESTRVFCTEYVIQNIKVDDLAGINGVKITIGEQKVNFALQVEDIESANKNIEQTIFELGAQQKDLKDELFILIETELNRARESFKGIRINQKNYAKIDPISALQSWRQDINSNLTSASSTSLTELNAKKSYLTNEITYLTSVLSDTLTLERFEKLNVALSKPVSIPNEKFTSELLKWLEEGLELHKIEQEEENHKQICEFCGNYFDSSFVKSIVDKKINTEYSKLIQAIDRFEHELPQSKDLVNIKTRLDKEILDNFNDAIIVIKKNSK